MSLMTRRHFLGTSAVLATAGLAGCGDGTTTRPAQSTDAGRRTIEHKYGSTDVSGTPRRVVTLGYTDLEPVLALGVAPLGIVEFFGSPYDATWPWEAEAWAGRTPEVVGVRDEFAFEAIAALRPDLVLGLYSGMTRGDYDKLSKLAPTVAQPKGFADFAAPTDLMTVVAGRALGRESRARELVRSVRGEVAAARRGHPEWRGQTVAVVEPAKSTELAVFGAADPKVAFFTDLGFEVAPAVRELEPGGDVATLSNERLDVIDVDRLIVLIDSGDLTEAQLREDRLFSRLDVVEQGRTLFLPFSDPPVGAALTYSSVLSVPYGLDAVLPELVRVPG